MKCLMMAAAAAMAFAAVAQDPVGPADGRRGPRGDHPVMRMGMQGPVDPVMRVIMNPKLAEKIGVTAEQSAKIKALSDDKDAVKALQEKVRSGMARQTELLKAEKIDEAAVMTALDQVWEARKELAKHQTKRIIAVKSILTAEQVKQATEALQAMRADARKPRGEGKRPRVKKQKDAE